MYGDEPGNEQEKAVHSQVFPVCTGMNRVRPIQINKNRCVPRVYGDEPYMVGWIKDNRQVFPVCTGMNRNSPF